MVGDPPVDVFTAVTRMPAPTTFSVCASATEVEPTSTVVVITSPAPAAAARVVARRTHHRARVLALTDSAEEGEAMHTIAAGAIGYVVLDRDRPGAAVLALRRTLDGISYVSAPTLAQMVGRLRTPPDATGAPQAVPDLSAEERQILVMLAGGMTNHRVGRRLSISEGTVRNRLAGIYRKLQVERRSEAIAKWSRLCQQGAPR